MAAKNKIGHEASELRRRAEVINRERTSQTSEIMEALSPEAAWRLIHELRVHQIELELQNEELHQTEEVLDATRARYFDLYDMAPVGYLLLNEHGLILEANLTFTTLLGVERKKLHNQALTRFIKTDDQDIYYLFRKRLFETGESQMCELRLVKKDGTEFWALLEALLTKNADGVEVCRLIVSDITERKRIDEVQLFLSQCGYLEQDEDFFASLAKYLAQSFGIYYVCIDRLLGDGLNAQTVAVYCDGHFEDNVEYALKDTPCGVLVGKNVCCFPRDVCALFPKDAALQELSAESYVGVTLWSFDGKPIGLIAVIDRKPLENRILAESLLKQVSVRAAGELERRRVEEALAESEGRYRAIIDQAPEAVLVCDPDTGEVIETNFRFTERFGYTLPKDGPLNLFTLIVDEKKNISIQLDKVKKTGVLAPQRRKFLHMNGIILNVERAATLVRFRNRTLFMMTLRDVSEEVRIEQEILRDTQLAVRVQKALLALPKPSEHLEIEVVYQPYIYVGGDLYFMDWRYRGEVLRGYVVDTMGHGIGTALHTSAIHVLLREVNELDLPLSEQMCWLNRRAGDYFDEGTFAGALGFEIDLHARQLRWACAGMPELWASTRKTCGVLTNPGMYLGMLKDEIFATHTLPLDEGDALYFMTDGLTELLSQKKEWPLDRFPDMVTLLLNLSESPNRRDDSTAICIRILSFPDPAIRQAGWPRVLNINGFGDYMRMKGEVSEILAEMSGLPHSVQEIAVNEALANAMEFRGGGRQYNARLRFNKVGKRLIIRVKTSRSGFAGNSVLRRLRAHPDEMFSFGEEMKMGRGIPIMLSLAHKMTYNNEGTELLLAWKLKQAFISKNCSEVV